MLRALVLVEKQRTKTVLSMSDTTHGVADLEMYNRLDNTLCGFMVQHGLASTEDQVE